VVALFLLCGCGGPNKANIVVRKENQELREEIERLKRMHEGDVAMIRALRESRGSATLPALPQDRIEQLFTTHGIQLGRLTGGARLQPTSPGDDALKVYACPTDDDNHPLKAAGSFVVEAFDLNQPENPLIGRWEFPAAEARKNWFGEALLYTYVLTCPLKHPPAHDQLTVRVSFTDELTGRHYDTQKVVRVTLPDAATTTPLTRP
jgi:hypothetical protein